MRSNRCMRSNSTRDLVLVDSTKLTILRIVSARCVIIANSLADTTCSWHRWHRWHRWQLFCSHRHRFRFRCWLTLHSWCSGSNSSVWVKAAPSSVLIDDGRPTRGSISLHSAILSTSRFLSHLSKNKGWKRMRNATVCIMLENIVNTFNFFQDDHMIYGQVTKKMF
jgi:hypothetical protein